MKKNSRPRFKAARSAVALGTAAALLVGGVSAAPMAAAATTEVQVSTDQDLPENPYVFLKSGDELYPLVKRGDLYVVSITATDRPENGTEYDVYVVAEESGPTEDDRPVGTVTPTASESWNISLEFVDGPVEPVPDPEEPEDPEVPELPAIPGFMSVYLVDKSSDELVHTGLRQEDSDAEAYAFEKVPAGTYELRVGQSPTNSYVVDESFDVSAEDSEAGVEWAVPADFDVEDYPRFQEEEDPVIPYDQNVYMVNSDGSHEGRRMSGGEGFFEFVDVPAGSYQLIVGPSVEDAVVVNDELIVTEANELRGSFAFRFSPDLDLDEQPAFDPNDLNDGGTPSTEGSSGSSFSNGLSSNFSFGSSL